MATRAIPTLLFYFLALSSISFAQGSDAPTLGEQLDLAEKRGQRHSAIEIIQRLLAEKPDDLDLLTRLARNQHSAGDLTRTAETLKRVASLGGQKRADVRELEGDLAKSQDRPADALSAYQLAHQAAPDSIRILLKLVQSHGDAGDREAVTNCYKKLAKLRKNAQDQRYLARAALWERNWNQMIRHLAIANEAERSPSSTLLKFETILSKSVQLKHLDREIAKSPRNVEALLDRAQLFESCNFNQEALADAKRAVGIDGRSPRVRYAVAFYHYTVGENQQCKEYNVRRSSLQKHRLSPSLMRSLANYDQKLIEKPDDRDVLRARAEVLMDFAQTPLAMEDVDRLLKADPDSATNQLLKVRALRLNNEPRAAKQLIRYLAKQHPENEDVQQEIGNIQVEDGLYADAIRTFDKILARRPRYEAARDARALCYKRLQRQPPASGKISKPVSG